MITCRSPNGLMWHDGTIPSSEVWVKLGGDKGHGSFKFNMQILQYANTERKASPSVFHTVSDQIVEVNGL